jgi:hypothetical protein
VKSLIDDSRGIICDHNMLIVHAAVQWYMERNDPICVSSPKVSKASRKERNGEKSPT